MGTDDEAEGDIYGKGKDTLSRRLQSGMNLQICFVNEPVEGSGSDLEDDGQAKEYHGSYHHDFSSGGVRSRSTGALSRECSNNSTSSGASQRVRGWDGVALFKAPNASVMELWDMFEKKKGKTLLTDVN